MQGLSGAVKAGYAANANQRQELFLRIAVLASIAGCIARDKPDQPASSKAANEKDQARARRRRAIAPTTPKPQSIIAHSPGSGTGETGVKPVMDIT
jgi:hypothetical protein